MWNIVAGASPRCNYVIFLKINLSCSAWGEAKGAKILAWQAILIDLLSAGIDMNMVVLVTQLNGLASRKQSATFDLGRLKYVGCFLRHL